MGKILIRDDPCILPHGHPLDRYCWNFRDHDPSERIRQRRLCTYEVEYDLLAVQLFDLYITVLGEVLETAWI